MREEDNKALDREAAGQHAAAEITGERTDNGWLDHDKKEKKKASPRDGFPHYCCCCWRGPRKPRRPGIKATPGCKGGAEFPPGPGPKHLTP